MPADLWLQWRGTEEEVDYNRGWRGTRTLLGVAEMLIILLMVTVPCGFTDVKTDQTVYHKYMQFIVLQ